MRFYYQAIINYLICTVPNILSLCHSEKERAKVRMWREKRILYWNMKKVIILHMSCSLLLISSSQSMGFVYHSPRFRQTMTSFPMSFRMKIVLIERCKSFNNIIKTQMITQENSQEIKDQQPKKTRYVKLTKQMWP